MNDIDYYRAKHDETKLRTDLIPPQFLEAVASVLTKGAEEYGANTWQHVPNGRERFYGALLRHIIDWRKGEKNDKSSKLPHLAHIITNACFLYCLEQFDNKASNYGSV